MEKYLPPGRNPMRVLNLASVGLPEIPVLGVHKLRRASPGLGMHRHPGFMEICYLAKGERIFHVDGRDYTLKGNDVFWTSAEEDHGSGANADGKGMQYWLLVRLPKAPRRFLTLSAGDAWPLVRKLRALPLRHFTGSLRLKELFEDAFRLSISASEPAPDTLRLKVATRLVEFFVTLVECAQRGGAPSYSPPVREALAWLETRSELPSIAGLAAHVHLSESRFKARFRAETGVPPGEYILRGRIRKALELLRTTQDSVTDIAYSLGFSSSQYFATTFRRFTNMTPREARRTRSKTWPARREPGAA
jgi:AraC-like DNA-binding protein